MSVFRKGGGGGTVKRLISFRRVYMSLIQDKLKVYGLQLTVFHSHINEVLITSCVYIITSAVSDQKGFLSKVLLLLSRSSVMPS